MTRDWVYISELGDHVGDNVLLKGWVQQKRSSGKIRFLVLRDGTGYLQCVAGIKDVSPETFEALDRVAAESSVIVRGTVRKEDRAPGGFELGLTELTVLHQAAEYPIQPKEHGVEFLFDNRHLYLRSRTPHAALKVRNEVVQSCRDFFYQRDFVLIDSPILTPNACEGTSTLFETPYFDEKAYLTQSGQLYLEPACMAFGRVYCFGPTFRAEKSKTRRHLTEFWMIEPEVAFLEFPGCSSSPRSSCRIWSGARSTVQGRVESPGARHDPPHQGRSAVSRITYDDASKIPAFARGAEEHGGRGGAGVRVRQRLRCARRDASDAALRETRDGHALARGDQVVLHAAGRERSQQGVGRGRSRAGGLRRNRRRIAAHPRPRPAAGTDPGAQAARGCLPVVSRHPQIRHGPALGLRHGPSSAA
jgi:asparaginyl-tRNA synthetase